MLNYKNFLKILIATIISVVICFTAIIMSVLTNGFLITSVVGIVVPIILVTILIDDKKNQIHQKKKTKEHYGYVWMNGEPMSVDDACLILRTRVTEKDLDCLADDVKDAILTIRDASLYQANNDVRQ